MIFTILIWIYIFLLTSLCGHSLFRGFSFILATGTKPDPSLSELSIIGIVAIGTFLSYYSIFFKIGLVSNLLIIIACFIYLLFNRKVILEYILRQTGKLAHISKTQKVLFSIYFILLMVAAQAYPKIADTGLYHAQFIQWIADYKTIPGLGNLHGRFAFNNQSFLLEAFFSLSFLKLRFFHLVNSYLLLVISFALIGSFMKMVKSDWIRSMLSLGLLILFQVFYLVFASSPTPDIFSAVGIWFIILIYLQRISLKENNRVYWTIIIFVSFFLVTVKLSTLPVILMIVIYIIESETRFWKKIIITGSVGLIVIIPYFIRNYLISGYLIYPYPFINLFDPDWKIPVSYVQEMRSIITSHAQSRDFISRPFCEWLPVWFSNLSAGFRILSLFILISPVITSIIILLNRKILDFFQSELRILVLSLFAILFWFFSAPNFRFIYGFLFIYLLITLMIYLYFFFYGRIYFSWLERIKQELLRLNFKRPVYFLLMIFPFLYFIKCDKGEIRRSVIAPVDYNEVKIRSVPLNNFVVNIPLDNTYCWNAPLPCSVFQKNIGVTDIELRGNGFEEGFRVKR